MIYRTGVEEKGVTAVQFRLTLIRPGTSLLNLVHLVNPVDDLFASIHPIGDEYISVSAILGVAV